MELNKRFGIADIAAIHGISSFRSSGGEFFAECPFCGNKKGKFSYIIKKGFKSDMYHCWVCGQGGGALKLHMELSGIRETKEAILDAFRQIEGDATYEARKKSIQEEAVVQTAERASDEKCSAVYYGLLSMLSLKEEDRNDLLSRGATEEDIRRFRFRSTPDRNFHTTKAICRSLVSQGLDLKGVPGFYQDKFGDWQMNIAADGYLCPVFDGDKNLITGFQIRSRNPDARAKYIWLSSAGRKMGASCGALCTYLPGKEGNPVIVVEGILKALVVYSLLKGEITIAGVPGVDAFKGMEHILREHPNAVLIEAYDMDKALRTDEKKLQEKSDHIAKCAGKLASFIREHNFPTFPLIWDMDKEGKWLGNTKGLDDFLLGYKEKEKFLAYIRNKADREVKKYQFVSGECVSSEPED